jgi:hypothetical protein
MPGLKSKAHRYVANCNKQVHEDPWTRGDTTASRWRLTSGSCLTMAILVKSNVHRKSAGPKPHALSALC